MYSVPFVFGKIKRSVILAPNQLLENQQFSEWAAKGDVTPFFRSESYESRLAASVSWQEDCEDHDQEKEAAFAGANRSENPGR